MKLNITKLLFSAAFIVFALIILPLPVTANAPDIHGEVYVSGTDSYLNPGGLRLWAKMTDIRDGRIHYRYNRTSSVDGHYTFFSWQDVARTNPEGMVNTWIVPDHPELPEASSQVDSRYVRQADSVQYVECEGGCPTVGFGCSELPLTITVIKPWNWSGTFSNVTINSGQVDSKGQTYSNGAFTFEALPIYYSGTNQASCTNFSAPDSVNANQSFSVAVTMNNPVRGNPWTSSANYRLGRQGDSDWIFPNGNQDRVNLPSSFINEGSSANFSFNVTAPSSPGTKNLGVQMVQDGVEWFGQICSKSIKIQPAGTPISPSIQGINIHNSGGAGSAERTSGLSADQGGTGYNNPLTIKLNASAGKNSDGTEANTTYYLAFYDKSSGAITNSSSFLTTITSRFDSNKSNGFLLAYDKTGTRCNGGKYCVYDGNKWINISGLGSSGYPVVGTSGILYTVFPGNNQNFTAEREWRLKLDRNFGSKNMFTAAYVFDKNNLSAYTPNGDIAPTTQ